jgi:hypothetical protein
MPGCRQARGHGGGSNEEGFGRSCCPKSSRRAERNVFSETPPSVNPRASRPPLELGRPQSTDDVQPPPRSPAPGSSCPSPATHTRLDRRQLARVGRCRAWEPRGFRGGRVALCAQRAAWRLRVSVQAARRPRRDSSFADFSGAHASTQARLLLGRQKYRVAPACTGSPD